MSNSFFVETSKELFTLIKNNKSFILLASIFSLFLGIFYSFSLDSKFEVYAEILPKQEETVGMQQNNSLISMLAQNNTQGNLSFFRSKMYSAPVAKILWNNGYNKVFFSNSYNQDLGIYEFEPSFWQKAKSNILGYEINSIIDHQNLSNLIENTFFLKEIEDSQSTLVYTLQKNPKNYFNLLQDLLSVTDKSIKSEKLKNIKNRINYLTEKIGSTSEVPVQTSLMLILEKTLLEEVLLSDDDSFYSIELVDEPQISKNPSFINLQFIYVGFFLLGFFISIAYLFIKKLYLNSSL